MAPVGTMIAAHKDIGVCLTQAEYHGADSHDLSGTAFNNMLQSTNVITDHAVLRGDGGARLAQDSGVLLDDSDNMAFPGTAYIGIREVRANGAAGLFLANDGGTQVLWITDSGDCTLASGNLVINSYAVDDISNDPTFAGADAKALVTEYACNNAIDALRYETSFVDGDLVAGDLTVAHSLGTTRPTHCMVYDNSGDPISCDWSITDLNTVVLKLAAEQTVRGGALTGTWYAKVLK